MERLPATADEIDAAWLTQALGARYPQVRVARVEVVERHEATNAHARLRVAYYEPAGAPTAIFCKLLPSDPARRPAVARTGMGPREALFYERLAPALAMRVPDAYFARHDARDGSFLLGIEDLVASGCTVSDGPTGVAPAAAARALEDLAELHVHFEDPARRQAEAAWVPAPRHDRSYGSTLLAHGLAHHRDRLSPQFAAISELYIAKGEALHELWQAGPKTVIHGDPHVGNLFDDHGRTGFLDWGILHVGTPLRDVGYFLCMALAIEDRRRHERDLLRHYLDARAQRGGIPIGFDEAWRAHRLHAAYTVVASCQIVTFPAQVSPGRRIFSDAFLARAEAAIADLEARAALRDFGGL
jgi:aminoglycoside phosphotransferase (APT) family kinase protein